MIMSIPDEGYSRDMLQVLNLISMFSLPCWTEMSITNSLFIIRVMCWVTVYVVYNSSLFLNTDDFWPLCT